MKKAKLTVVRDGWQNVLTKFGITGKDKTMATTVDWVLPVETDLEHLYSHDDVSRKVVDLLPSEAFREGITFKKEEGVKQDVITAFEESVESLYVYQRFEEAWKWGRLYGGAAIFIAVDDGRKLEEPLDVKNIKKVNALTVLNKFELNPVSEEIENDLNSPMFGMPRVYSLSTKESGPQQTQNIHHTRLIRFDGNKLPRLLFIQNNRWHDSILSCMKDAIQSYNIANGSVGRLVQDFSMTVLKLKDLADLLQDEDGKTKLTERLEIMNLSKSILSTIVIDAEDESLESLSQSVAGIHDLVDKVTNRLVVAAGIPATILLGISPTGGMSGKGESENRDWYDSVANKREMVIRPRLKKVFTLLQIAKQGPTRGKPIPGFEWEFNPLWQMDEKEQAEIRKVMADADAIYLDRGVIDADEVAKSRFGPEFTVNTTIDFEEREALSKPEPEPGVEEKQSEVNAAKTGEA